MAKARAPRSHAKRLHPKREPYRIYASGPGLMVSIEDIDLSRIAASLVEALAGGARPVDGERERAAETLGVRPDATQAEVNEAYVRKLVKTLSREDLDKAIQVAVAERELRDRSVS